MVYDFLEFPVLRLFYQAVLCLRGRLRKKRGEGGRKGNFDSPKKVLEMMVCGCYKENSLLLSFLDCISASAASSRNLIPHPN